jgi:hypothetical protein
MKAGKVVVLLVLVIAGVIATGHGAATATHLGYKGCPDMTFRRAVARHVKSNFGCRGARRTLRGLLAHGLGGLPKPTLAIGRWGCTNTHFHHFYQCERRKGGTQAPPGVVFAGSPRRH